MMAMKKKLILLVIAAIIGYSCYLKVSSGVVKSVAIELPDNIVQSYGSWNLGEFTDDDEHCLALNIYFEARGETSIRGKYAVADVVMYRYMNARYPNEVCNIVKEGRYRNGHPIRHKCQFSWWCNGKENIPREIAAFEEAMIIAKEVLHDPNYIPRIEYAIFYHANYVKPKWARTKEFVGQIGNHLFYR